ncbi:hypothetical protein COCSUDRAFT_34555 [Coccomyxa subellipsoidea C-169]|uniref:DNA/RNA-binding protein Alba-like domain-containing protein n=1 Tax=Coccomyxa subellipsoidea (strain C-169) TaxID=574566 RepID=I0YJ10_COCSC|nr:hypothetical protein COCSUDRAFT_34555 [Coccomyxa subellipsoidea C-169]EIE18379.1 hypothetical protein COCSUDRAFT_34555 [Coccomyxa subellipsoidea C-169]|eukprot:XP_005642923.1 hypothetical protein COCSUDRAFT_34555 [Coccomyxa subellipsoidea C-169]
MDDQQEHPARVQVSATKKPLHFYVELAKRFLQEHGQVQLSAIGLAIPMMVNLAEILKANRWATEIKIRTGLYQLPGEPELPASGLPKAKMEIVLSKSAEFDDIMAGPPAPPPRRTRDPTRRGVLRRGASHRCPCDHCLARNFRQADTWQHFSFGSFRTLPAAKPEHCTWSCSLGLL